MADVETARTFPYVILGGGMVAGYAAKELVERGLGPNQLAIVSADDTVPYERPPLSKGFLAGKEDTGDILISPPEFYVNHGIALYCGSHVDRLDLYGRTLSTGSAAISFGKLVIATGSRVRTLDVPNAGLEGILYLRSVDDSRRIREQAEGASRAVVLGAGFIGMEVASVLAARGIDTTLIFPEERVWERLFTPEISSFFAGTYASRGVTLMPGEQVVSFEGDGRVSAVVLKSGARIETDLVVAGIGVTPEVELFSGNGLRLGDGIEVNEYLETGVRGVYAAGDVANYRDVLFGKRRRVEHWDNAVEQAKHVARQLTGERLPFVHVPYFFSDVFDLSYEFWGDTEGADDVCYRGDPASPNFSAWWLRREMVIAAFIMGQPDEERDAAPEWIAERVHRSPRELQGSRFPR